jgi:DNA-binding NarL/FixJ family response regulator
MTRKPIAICVVDDHPVVAEGIARVVEPFDDIKCVGVAASAARLTEILGQHAVDVAILDVRLGSASGIELCASIRLRHPTVRVLMLSSFGDIGVVRRALAAGASGFAVKSIALDMLPAAIRQIHAGGTFLSPELMLGAMQLQPSPQPAGDGLSPREQEIVQLISAGKSNKEIARELGLSSHTVKLHVSRLLKRFSFQRRSQLSNLAST